MVWFGYGWSYGHDGGRDLACVDQGLTRLCVNLRSCGLVPTLDCVFPF
jgi:hypothetical protein